MPRLLRNGQSKQTHCQISIRKTANIPSEQPATTQLTTIPVDISSVTPKDEGKVPVVEQEQLLNRLENLRNQIATAIERDKKRSKSVSGLNRNISDGTETWIATYFTDNVAKNTVNFALFIDAPDHTDTPTITNNSVHIEKGGYFKHHKIGPGCKEDYSFIKGSAPTKSLTPEVIEEIEALGNLYLQKLQEEQTKQSGIGSKIKKFLLRR